MNLPRWECQRCGRLISQKKQAINIKCERCSKLSPHPNLSSLHLSHDTYYEYEKMKIGD